MVAVLQNLCVKEGRDWGLSWLWNFLVSWLHLLAQMAVFVKMVRDCDLVAILVMTSGWSEAATWMEDGGDKQGCVNHVSLQSWWLSYQRSPLHLLNSGIFSLNTVLHPPNEYPHWQVKRNGWHVYQRWCMVVHMLHRSAVEVISDPIV